PCVTSISLGSSSSSTTSWMQIASVQSSTTACLVTISREPPQRCYPTPCDGACPAPVKRLAAGQGCGSIWMYNSALRIATGGKRYGVHQVSHGRALSDRLGSGGASYTSHRTGGALGA